MKPTIEPITMRDYNSVIIALFGSYENYRNSPQLRTVLNRIHFLNEAKRKIWKIMEEDISGTQWWNLWGKISNWLAVKIVYVSLFKTLDKHIAEYEKLRPVPATMLIRAADKELDETWKIWHKVMVSAGVEKYKND